MVLLVGMGRAVAAISCKTSSANSALLECVEWSIDSKGDLRSAERRKGMGTRKAVNSSSVHFGGLSLC